MKPFRFRSALLVLLLAGCGTVHYYPPGSYIPGFPHTAWVSLELPAAKSYATQDTLQATLRPPPVLASLQEAGMVVYAYAITEWDPPPACDGCAPVVARLYARIHADSVAAAETFGFLLSTPPRVPIQHTRWRGPFVNQATPPRPPTVWMRKAFTHRRQCMASSEQEALAVLEALEVPVYAYAIQEEGGAFCRTCGLCRAPGQTVYVAVVAQDKARLKDWGFYPSEPPPME